MKAKTLLLACLCVLCLTTTGETTGETTDPPTGAEQILLQGLLDLNAGLNDVEAYVDDNYVYVSFHRNFGNVSISLYNPNGLIVYSDVVNTAVQQLVVIPITGFVDGVYTIVLENATGYADGDFEKNSNN